MDRFGTALTSPRALNPRQDLMVVGLGAWLVVGVFVDGWAHFNSGELESFFTPWHGVLYSGATALFGYLLLVSYRLGGAPRAYAPALVGAPLFLLAGLADLGWHQVFGLESGVDALLSPTHLLLLTAGLLVLTSPWRADARRGGRPGGTAVLALGLATALAAFFLLYTSVFAFPGASWPLTTIPEGAPGHLEAELPVLAGLSGYLVSTVLLVVPVLLVARRGRPPAGTLTALLTGVVTLSAAVTEFEQPFAPLAGLLAGAAVEWTVRATLGWPPGRRAVAVAAIVPATLWPLQLAGVAVTDGVAWPIELWTGVVLLCTAAAGLLGWLSAGPAPAFRADPHVSDAGATAERPGPGRPAATPAGRRPARTE